VRRAQLALEMLERSGLPEMSNPGAAGLAVPVAATPE
jgi:hypothetical protein